MDLRDDDWLQVRLYARSRNEWTPGTELGAGDVVFEYTPAARWVRLRATPATSSVEGDLADIHVPQASGGEVPEEAQAPQVESPEAPADVWFEAPHPDLVAPALGWLTALDLQPGIRGRPGGRSPTWNDANLGWWMRLTRKTAGRFAESWEHRPHGVAFFGTPRLRRMLSGEMRVWPKLKIESSGIDWFSVSAEWEAEGLRLTDEDLAALRNSQARFVKISTGWVQRDIADVHDAAANVLADLGIEAGGGTQRLSLWQLAGAQPESLKELEKFGVDPETLAAVQRLRQQVARFKGLPAVKRPPGLAGDLRPYQQRGLEFLAYTSGLGVGSVLADDMGLGKTYQALAWLLHLRRQDPQGGPSLVVCPASVVHNWEREAQRFAPKLRVLLLTSGKTRHELRRAIPEHDLVVTNYALLRRDVEAWRDVKLRAVIFDEAQQIKNPDAAVTRAAAVVQAQHRLALTGTPLENRALDLFSIVDVINPGYLGRRSHFQQRFDKPDAPPHVRALLAAKLRPILLRRTKKEVAPELPDRIEEQWDCEMTAQQRQLYLAEVKQSREMIARLTGTRGGIAQNKIHILAALTRLRQICCHPKLAGGTLDAGSGKFEAFLDLIDPILAEGHKVLVFSQFVECIRLLRAELKARDIEHHVLTGQSTKRAAIIDAFQNSPNPNVFLISLKAGGTGLNLTAASYVVLFDPWWNPAVEAQAIDRTHRIGQDRTVIAYRLITRGSIEEKIFQLQQRKAALVRDILGEDGFARSLTREDLDYLLEEA
jgi:superfamily II DNA or RNA helicase